MHNVKKILAIMGGFALVLIAVAAFTGCDGDDPQCGSDGQPPCDVQQDGGTDGTPNQQDAGDGSVVKDDGGDSGTGDPCAPFEQHLTGWYCQPHNSPPPVPCNFTSHSNGATCKIICAGSFYCDTAPPEMISSQAFTCITGSWTAECTR